MFAKSKLNSIEVLISKALIDSDKDLIKFIESLSKNQKYDGYQRKVASIVYKFFNKKTSGNAILNENMSDQRPSDLAK